MDVELLQSMLGTELIDGLNGSPPVASHLPVLVSLLKDLVGSPNAYMARDYLVPLVPAASGWRIKSRQEARDALDEPLQFQTYKNLVRSYLDRVRLMHHADDDTTFAYVPDNVDQQAHPTIVFGRLLHEVYDGVSTGLKEALRQGDRARAEKAMVDLANVELTMMGKLVHECSQGLVRFVSQSLCGAMPQLTSSAAAQSRDAASVRRRLPVTSSGALL